MLRKRALCFIFVLLTGLFVVGGVQGQTAIRASTTANVFARVYTVISSVKTSHVSFGHYYPGSYDGLLINKPDGILSVKGNTEKGGDIHYSTSFDVSGDEHTAFAITLPKSSIVLMNRSDAKILKVSNWKYVSFPGSGEGELPYGYKKVDLDATLRLGSPNDNPVGFYSGYYTITFGFN